MVGTTIMGKGRKRIGGCGKNGKRTMTSIWGRTCTYICTLGWRKRRWSPSIIPFLREFRYARCDVVPNSALPPMERESIKGAIYFRQMPMKHLEAKVILEGFPVKQEWAREDHKHLRGLHGHEFGDLSNGCNSLGGHINPLGVSHGGPEAEHRHLGDFGNIEVLHDGTATMSFTDDVASLFGSDSLLGRSMVIHTAADDLGGGGSEASKQYGNAGGRSACCIVAASPKPAGVWTDVGGGGDGDGLARPAKPKHMHKHN